MNEFIVYDSKTLRVIRSKLSYMEAKELEAEKGGSCTVSSLETYRVLVRLRAEVEVTTEEKKAAEVL